MPPLLGVDACAGRAYASAIYVPYHHITVMGKRAPPCLLYITSIVGGLRGVTISLQEPWLPEVAVGDLLFTHDTGAHGFLDGL